LVDGVRTQSLRGSNLCQLQAWVDPQRSRVIVAAAIDNLVKGAAGQAVQNGNLMLGLDEILGLPGEPAWL
jgi:N-acetyl-gamma-glutamyl-phosphate reductase